jgi:hypothetical protein
LGLPSPAGQNGRVVWYLRGQRVPPPDWAAPQSQKPED